MTSKKAQGQKCRECRSLRLPLLRASDICMNTFACLFTLLSQIRSENKNKATRGIPRGGITFLALGFDLAKTIWNLLQPCKHQEGFLSSAGLWEYYVHLGESRRPALSGFLGSLHIYVDFHSQDPMTRDPSCIPMPGDTLRTEGGCWAISQSPFLPARGAYLNSCLSRSSYLEDYEEKLRASSQKPLLL